MTRTVVAYVLAATTLICPYLCLGQSAGKPAAHSDAKSCSCHKGPSSPSDKPPENRDEQEPDCLCHGAIVDGVKVGGQIALADFDFVRFLDVVSEVGAATSSCERVIDGTLHPCHFPPRSSGREICELRGSLLL